MSFRGRGHFPNLSRGRGNHNQRFSPYPARPSIRGQDPQQFGFFETPFKQQQQFEDQSFKQQQHFDHDPSFKPQQQQQLTDQQKNQLYYTVINSFRVRLLILVFLCNITVFC